MKTTFLLLILLFSTPVFAQKQKGVVHGQVFGSKPDTTGVINADKLEQFMGGKARLSVAIRCRVIRVTKEKGGWFTFDGGKGSIIAAHFKNYNVTIPKTLAGKTVILDGVAAKQFIAADHQHLAGNARSGKESPKPKPIAFEVKGMYVDH